MRNAMKVAKWEIKRNMKNKSYLIGLFLTPALILAFGFLGSIFGNVEEAEKTATTVYIQDELGLFDTITETAKSLDLNWELHETDITEDKANDELASSEETAYLFLNENTLEDGSIPVYLSEDMDSTFINQLMVLETPIKTLQLQKLGLSDEQLAAISTGIQFEEKVFDEVAASGSEGEAEDPAKQFVPGLFAGIILFSIVVTGMYIFQSASQEKKDKIAEIILSSITPGELMQGKIMGYFVLGIIQATVLLAFAIPMALWKTDIPIIEYLLVPETLLLVGIAILGYLLFASLFVGIGATMADVSSAGNFQGLVMMLPFLPIIFMGPVIDNPSGIVAKIGTYFPFTTPGVLLMRLTALDEWPWIEIGISLVVLLISIVIMMKLAGKIFKVGILMYGKNATPAEIWKWLWA